MINLFSTPIKVISFNNFKEINIKIFECMMLGFKKNFNENLPKDKAEEIEKIFKDEAELYLKELTNKQIDLRLVQSWTTSTLKHQFQTPHDHYENTVIAVYYYNTNDNSGDLLLHDPRGATGFISNYEKDFKGNLLNSRSYYRFKPKTGDLILFPGYVIHSVEPNMSDEIRISLAMNFKYKDFNQFNPD